MWSVVCSNEQRSIVSDDITKFGEVINWVLLFSDIKCNFIRNGVKLVRIRLRNHGIH